jgi:hypothetical protein
MSDSIPRVLLIMSSIFILGIRYRLVGTLAASPPINSLLTVIKSVLDYRSDGGSLRAPLINPADTYVITRLCPFRTEGRACFHADSACCRVREWKTIPASRTVPEATLGGASVSLRRLGRSHCSEAVPLLPAGIANFWILELCHCASHGLESSVKCSIAYVSTNGKKGGNCGCRFDELSLWNLAQDRSV